MNKTNNNNQKFFSVIIPLYNAEEYLEKCIGSVVDQKFRDYELLLIDDGSIDRSPEICDNFSKKYENTTTYHKRHVGLVSARNYGLAYAKGKYIVWVDSDDWISPVMLETIHKEIISNNYPDIVAFNYYEVYKDHTDKSSYGTNNKIGLYAKDRLEKEIYPCLISPNTLCKDLPFACSVWSKVFKRELAIRYFCKDKSIVIAEDLCFSAPCIYHANTVLFCPEHLYYYNRCNQKSLTKILVDQSFDSAVYNYLKFIFRFKKNISLQIIHRTLLIARTLFFDDIKFFSSKKFKESGYYDMVKMQSLEELYFPHINCMILCCKFKIPKLYFLLIKFMI